MPNLVDFIRRMIPEHKLNDLLSKDDQQTFEKTLNI